MRIRVPVAKLTAVALFAALCAIVAAWALVLLAPRAPVAPSGAVAQAQPPVDLSRAAQLFGGVPQPASAALSPVVPSNIQVTGVLAAGARGVALLAVDGKPARPFAIGESVADGLSLASVSGDTVELRRSGELVKLPAPVRASTDTLNSGAAGTDPSTTAAPVGAVRPTAPAPARARSLPQALSAPAAAAPQPMPIARPTPPAGAAALSPQQAIGTVQPQSGGVAPAVGVVAPVLNALSPVPPGSVQ